MIVTNVRHPRDFRGDLAAMIGSARIGERRMQALIAEFGSEQSHAAIEAILDSAERQARAVIASWKDGVYKGEAESQLAVGVNVRRARATSAEPEFIGLASPSFARGGGRRRPGSGAFLLERQQQQQQ